MSYLSGKQLFIRAFSEIKINVSLSVIEIRKEQFRYICTTLYKLNKPNEEVREDQKSEPSSGGKTGNGTSSEPQKSVTLETKPYKLWQLEDAPSATSTVTHEEAVTMLGQMLRIRSMEKNLEKLYLAKLARGFCHIYSGQEAVAVGIRSVIREKDTVTTSYRCHGWTYLMGQPTKSIIAEMIQRIDGCSKGKGGSMHLYALPNFFGGNGIVGAPIPLGTGAGFAHKYRNDGGISVTLFGDGASNQGQGFEAINMAKLWGLPVLYCCENNLYGMGTAVYRSSATTDIFMKYQMLPGIQCDGMDIMAVREAVKFSIDYIQKNGPLLIEFCTYRYSGHSMSDPGVSYRNRNEIENVRKTRDPITTFQKKLLDSKLITDDEFEKIKSGVNAEIKEAVEFAKKSQPPPSSELANDLYSNFAAKYVRGTTFMDHLPHATQDTYRNK